MGLVKLIGPGLVFSSLVALGAYSGGKAMEYFTEGERINEIKRIESSYHRSELDRKSDLIWTEYKHHREISDSHIHGGILGGLAVGTLGFLGLVYLSNRGYLSEEPEKPIEPFDSEKDIRGKTEEELYPEYDYRELF